MVKVIIKANQNQLEQDILETTSRFFKVRQLSSLERGNHGFVLAELARGSLAAISKQVSVVRRTFQSVHEDIEHLGLLMLGELREMVGSQHLPHSVGVGH
jgi:hypothetical protein